MADLREIKSRILVDERIDSNEVDAIRQYIDKVGQIDLEDMKFLVELSCEAKHICPTFRELLFRSLREHVLADGVVTLSEQFHLLRTLHADGKIDDEELQFIEDLKQGVGTSTAEFDSFYGRVLEEAAEKS